MKRFNFELEGTPRLIGGRYECSGYPRCRFADKQQIILLNYVLSRSGAFALGDNEVAILRRPLIVTNGVFRHGLQFFVNSMDKEFAISDWNKYEILSYQRISNHDFPDA